MIIEQRLWFLEFLEFTRELVDGNESEELVETWKMLLHHDNREARFNYEQFEDAIEKVIVLANQVHFPQPFPRSRPDRFHPRHYRDGVGGRY